MKIQKSFNNEKATLYIIPTPIGNLDDITVRSLNTLNNLEILFCEDTRVTQKLLNHFNIRLKLYTYHEFNQDVGGYNILNILASNQDVGLVSDAGMPGISDPGFDIIKQCIDNDYNVVVLPGACALNVAIVRSNLAPKQFTYFGFLNKQQSKRLEEIKYLYSLKHASIIYESPHKLLKTLETIALVSPNASVVVARELTKKFEEYVSGLITDVIKHYNENGIKGECVIVFKPEILEEVIENPIELYKSLINSENFTKKDAIKDVAKRMGVNKNQVYQMVIESEIQGE